jgi:hypothetical protein
MNALLVRVAVDQSVEGGSWNGPVDSLTREFAYVAIPEHRPVHPGLGKPYAALAPVLERFGVRLPAHLAGRSMHLDPDFKHLTYGDHRERAKQLRAHLGLDDLVVFYAGLKDIRSAAGLVYAIIGLFVVDGFRIAADVPTGDRDMNAHSRRTLAPGAQDLIVVGRHAVSGRLRTCLPIGEYRNGAYRVRRDLLGLWGGLSVKDGYLQRSARLPRLLDPPRFLDWLRMHEPSLMPANN